mmetsp:Transcript_87808/g.272846  ORF Transcript_87808/g.272846 Transcript_87808/m.272846 type:complete len:319 (-) Transcript_87808:739-1695(-)
MRPLLPVPQGDAEAGRGAPEPEPPAHERPGSPRRGRGGGCGADRAGGRAGGQGGGRGGGRQLEDDDVPPAPGERGGRVRRELLVQRREPGRDLEPLARELPGGHGGHGARAEDALARGALLHARRRLPQRRGRPGHAALHHAAEGGAARARRRAHLARGQRPGGEGRAAAPQRGGRAPPDQGGAHAAGGLPARAGGPPADQGRLQDPHARDAEAVRHRGGGPHLRAAPAAGLRRRLQGGPHEHRGGGPGPRAVHRAHRGAHPRLRVRAAQGAALPEPGDAGRGLREAVPARARHRGRLPPDADDGHEPGREHAERQPR